MLNGFIVIQYELQEEWLFYGGRILSRLSAASKEKVLLVSKRIGIMKCIIS